MSRVSKRIAFIIPSVDFGGAELQVINQINYLVQTNAFVVLIVIDGVKELQDNINLPSERLIELYYPVHESYGRAIRKAPSLANKISQVLVREQIEVVVANLPFTHFICRLVKFKFLFSSFRFQLINYHHSLQYEESPLDSGIKKAFNICNSFLARFLDDKNIFISEASKSNVAEHFYVKRPVIIYNSVPLRRPDPRLARDYINNKGLRFGHYTIVFPGRLHLAKGHAFFVEVLDRFVRSNQIRPEELQVMIVGGGPLENEISNLISSKSLQAYTHITGFVSNDLLLSFLANSNLVVIPSLFEGFGNVALEALMVNKLILASDAGGLKEIIRDGENGFQFRVQDSGTLLEKLNFLYRNRSKELIPEEKLAEDFRSRFSFEAHMDKLIQEINSCVA